jgi:ATP-dependent Lon protease
MLIYISREYEKITNSRDLYREKKIKIPTPEFIVLYNGKEEFPDYKEMRLSDSYEIKNDTCFLELVAKVYNINKGRNADIANRSPVLSGYEEFIAEIKENLNSMNLAEAIRLAIKTCLSKNILVYFLREHGSEVENMLITEWNTEEAIAVAREEAWEEGVDIGRKMERKELFALWESGVSLAEAKELLRERKIVRT